MRLSILIGLFLLISTSDVIAVDMDSLIVQDSVYIVSDIPPGFPGCDLTLPASELKECTQANLLNTVFSVLKFPKEVHEQKKGGFAVSSFVINTDGSMSDINLIKDPGLGMGEEAIRILELLKETVEWAPAQVDGQPVRFRYVLPIRFKVDLSGKPPWSAPQPKDMFLVFKAWGGKEVFRGMVPVTVQNAIPGKYIKNIETYDIPKSKAVYNVIGSANIVHFRPKKLARPQELMDHKSIIMDDLLPEGFAVRNNTQNNNLIMTLGKVEKPMKLYIHNYIGEVIAQQDIATSNGHIEKIDISDAPEGVLFVSLALEDHFASALVVKD